MRRRLVTIPADHDNAQSVGGRYDVRRPGASSSGYVTTMAHRAGQDAAVDPAFSWARPGDVENRAASYHPSMLPPIRFIEYVCVRQRGEALEAQLLALGALARRRPGVRDHAPFVDVSRDRRTNLRAWESLVAWAELGGLDELRVARFSALGRWGAEGLNAPFLAVRRPLLVVSALEGELTADWSRSRERRRLERARRVAVLQGQSVRDARLARRAGERDEEG